MTYKNGQWYSALAALTEEESQSIATGAEVGNGAKTWKKGREEMGHSGCWQKSSVAENRHRVRKLSIPRSGWCIEKWEARAGKYEKREERGERLKLTRDLKMTTFENLLPLELGNHLVLNKKRLKTYEAQKKEIERIINSRVGANFREVPMGCRRIARGGDPMDVIGWTTNKKGKSRGKSNQNLTGQGKFDRGVFQLPQAGTSCGRALVEDMDE